MRWVALTLASLLAPLSLTACAGDPLAEQYREGANKGYIAGDGRVTQIGASERGAPVPFSGESESGQFIDSANYAGRPMVVNFWYAACAPCRAEAPALETLSQEFPDAAFVGVNVRDQAPNALAFNATYGVTYPSIMDADTGAVKLAFSATVPPNAVPTTLVLDRNSRIAARILGPVDPSILGTLIGDALAEETVT